MPHVWGESPSGGDEVASHWGEYPTSDLYTQVEYPPDESDYVYNDDYGIREYLNLERYYFTYFKKFHNRQEEEQYEVIEENTNIPPGSYSDIDPDFPKNYKTLQEIR